MKKKTTLLLIGIFLMIGLAASAFFGQKGCSPPIMLTALH